MFWVFLNSRVIFMVIPHGKLYSYLTTFSGIRSTVKEEVNAKTQVTLITALDDSLSRYGK